MTCSITMQTDVKQLMRVQKMMNNMPNQIIFDNNKANKRNGTNQISCEQWQTRTPYPAQIQQPVDAVVLFFHYPLLRRKIESYTNKNTFKANVVLFIWLKYAQMELFLSGEEQVQHLSVWRWFFMVHREKRSNENWSTT